MLGKDAIPVAVLCNGDDGLTARLCDATKEVFHKSPDFTEDIANRPNILRVTIPTNVKWKRIAGKTKVFYTVEFSLREEHDLGTTTGSCWDSNLKECANQILVQTRKVTGRLTEEPRPSSSVTAPTTQSSHL